MESIIKQLNPLLLQTHEILEKTTERSCCVGCAQYIPQLDAVLGYLENEKGDRLAISVKHGYQTVHVVVGNKNEDIKYRCEFSSIDVVSSPKIVKLYQSYVLTA